MAKMRQDRVWIGGGVAAAIVIAGASWLFLLSPQFDAKAQAEADLADTQMQNIVLQRKISALREQNGKAPELQAELDAARAAVPAQHDMEGFTRQLSEQAALAGVQITQISPGSPTMIEEPAPAKPPAAKEGSATGTEPAGSPADAAADAQKPVTQPSAKPTGPAGHLYSIDVTIVTTGPMDAQRAFLSALEKDGTRRALVTTTTFALADDGSGDWSLTTQLETFVAPVSPDQEAALQAPAGPAN